MRRSAYPETRLSGSSLVTASELNQNSPTLHNYSRAGARFSSHDVIEWAKGPFDDGAEARIFGYGLDQCPSEDTIGPFAVRSWKAGWADADAQIAADGGPVVL
jgi:hypothetical protein